MINPILTPSDFQTLLHELKKHVTKPVEAPMSKQQACEFLGVGMTTLDRYMKQGLPFYRPFGRPVFYASQLNEWIKTKKK